MSTRVSSILAEIGIDSSKFSAGAKGVMGGIGDMLGGFGKMLPGIGLVATAFGVLIDQLKKAQQAAVESAREDAKLEAVLNSTGFAAGMTAIQLDELATSLSKAAGIDDELVKAGESVLLTFTKISGEVFPDTIRAAADMAAVLGGDLNGKITMIGKAMNDFSGYTALKRAGVSFTEEQLKQISNFKETNDLMGYQKLILGELQTEYGGAAEAINKAGDGAENTKIAFGNLQEAIGEDLIPVARAWNELLTDIYEKSANNINRQRDFGESMERLGYTFLNSGVYVKDWKFITAAAAAEMVAAEQAAYGEEKAIESVGIAAGITEEQLKELTDANREMISMTESFTQAEQRYLESSQTIAEERAVLLEQRAELIKKGYKETSQAIADVDGKLAANGQKASDVADAHELATRRIILGYIEQKAMADGILTDEEMEWLLEKGVEWGIYSETAIQMMKDVQAEWEGWDPGDKKASFIVSSGPGGTLPGDIGLPGKPGATPNGGFASGADFIVPSGYPNDSFPMRVQSGEHVQVTPAGKTGQPQPYNGPSAKDIGREAGEAFAVKLMQLGLV